MLARLAQTINRGQGAGGLPGGGHIVLDDNCTVRIVTLVISLRASNHLRFQVM